MFYFNKYQKYFLPMQKMKFKILNFDVGKFLETFFIVKKCTGWSYQVAGNLNFC